MKIFELTIQVNSLEECYNLAKKLANIVPEYTNTITLKGDLGTGKTTFSRYFIQNLLKDNIEVTSPTFNLAHVYGNDKKIWHFDLYRLKTEEELYEVGIEEALESYMVLIEWPELAQHFLPFDRLDIEIIWINDTDKRILKLKTLSKNLYNALKGA